MILLWILLLPVCGALLNGICIRSKNAALSGTIGTLAVLGSFILSLKVVLSGEDISYLAFNWIEAGTIHIPFTLETTVVTKIMMLVVTGIGTLIHLYSVSYMSHDKSPWRFFAYLNLFLAAMLTLILSGNLVGIFMGWEGVGLCSYLLIGFWYDKDANAAAGMKAFLTNRVGDLGFIVALMLLVTYAGTTQISELLPKIASNEIPGWVLTAAAFGFFWASTGKSAQIPLYTWLPDAMAGPTPVSALIHAATMVTSGIFLTTRAWPLFADQPDVLNSMLWIGTATAWLAALIALTQRDIKKVLAYSTVSQLGFMFAALGAGSPAGAMFHVVTHACFKALLFLGAGSVIHGMHEEQDLFKMGGLRKHMTWTHLTFLIGTLAIIGFPLTSGFFSKDYILAKAFEKGPLFYVLLLSAALLTAFYMLRCYALAFWGEARSDHAKHAHESSPVLLLPLVLLAILSLAVGFLETPTIFGDVHLFQRWIESSWGGWQPAKHGEHMSHATEWMLVGVTTVLSLCVAAYSFARYKAFKAGPECAPGGWMRLSLNKFYIDELYGEMFIRPLKLLSRLSNKFIDGTLINGGVHLLRDGARGTGSLLSVFHTGNVQTYAWYLAIGTALALATGVWFIQ